MRSCCPACGAPLDWMAWGPCAYGPNGVEAYVCGSRYTPEGVKERCK